MEASEAIRANPEEVPYEGLLLVLNENNAKCKNCGHVHKFITLDCKPMAIRSDDDRAIVAYGTWGDLIPIDQSELSPNVELAIRDHRNDQSTKTDGDLTEGIKDSDESSAD